MRRISIRSTRTSNLPFWDRLKGLHFQQTTLGVFLVLPLVSILVGLLVFPILSGFAISMQSKLTGAPGRFIGLKNYIDILSTDKVVAEVFINTVTYTFFSVAGKTLLGLVAALVLNEKLPGRNAFRGWLLLPWIAPTLVTALTWRWMFDQTGGIINYVLYTLNLVDIPPAWLANKIFAKIAIIVANIWRGFPFFAVTILAGLQTIPVELYESAEIDGASIWQRLRYVTLPSIAPVMLVVVILSTIWTFNDFTLVWVMTGGGPSYATHIFATYAYSVGLKGGRIGYATAVSLMAVPLVVLFIFALVPRMWREEN